MARDLTCGYCDGKGCTVDPCGDGTFEPHECDNCEGSEVDPFAAVEQLTAAGTALLNAWDNNGGSGRLPRAVIDGLRDAIARATGQPAPAEDPR